MQQHSNVRPIHPFIDVEGILRIGGRIQRPVLAKETQYPVLLTKSWRIAQLVVCWCHEQVSHAGRGMTTNQKRSSGFWVIRCNSLVRCIILKCTRCKQLVNKFADSTFFICQIICFSHQHSRRFVIRESQINFLIPQTKNL